MSAAFRKPKRGVHSFEFIRNDPAPRYSDSNLDTWDGLRDEDQEQREKNAVLRARQYGHTTPVVPVTSENLPKDRAVTLALGVVLGMCMGVLGTMFALAPVILR